MTEGQTMKKIAMMLLAVGILAAAAPAADVEGFQTKWAEAKKLAETQDKPLFLHFTTTWCSWCRKIEDDVYRKEEGKAALAPFVPASLDCTVPRGQAPTGDAKVHIELMKKFGGRGYPFLVMVTPDGVVLNKFSGYKPIGDFKKELTKATATYEEYKQLQKEAKAKGDTYEFNARAMKVYAKIGQWDRAIAAAKTVRTQDPKNKKNDGADAVMVLLQGARKSGDEKRIEQLTGAIRKLDPKNEKGVLQKALFSAAQGTLDKAGAARQSNPEASKKLLATAAEQLTEVAALPNLTDAQQPLAYLGQVRKILGEKKKSIAAFEKALAVDPDSPMAPRIQQIIDSLKKGE
jgi:thioredoxin-related protein